MERKVKSRKYKTELIINNLIYEVTLFLSKDDFNKSVNGDNVEDYDKFIGTHRHWDWKDKSKNLINENGQKISILIVDYIWDKDNVNYLILKKNVIETLWHEIGHALERSIFSSIIEGEDWACAFEAFYRMQPQLKRVTDKLMEVMFRWEKDGIIDFEAEGKDSNLEEVLKIKVADQVEKTSSEYTSLTI